ncbi:MAG: tetratricopeptide repeat protein, partial [Stenotrophomonas maltophilia]
QADPVPVSRVAQLLLSAQVPLVVVAAGQQSDPGHALYLWPAAGRVLAQAGVPQAAILPNALHGADTTEQFLQEMYQALTQGCDLGTSLARARRSLMDNPHRLTLAGKKVFWDWITPQIYESAHYTPPVIEEEAPDPLAPPVIPGAEEEDTGTPLPAAGQYGLVGRNLEIREVERLFQRSPVVLLSGDTGAGKTELALGISRWYQRTFRDQLPGGVFYSTFEASHPAGLERIIHEIGTSAAGLEFADMNARQQRLWVLDYLQKRPSLLVWDNIQNVAGDAAREGSGLLTLDEQAELNEFIAQVTQGGSASRLLLVSQHPSLLWLTAPFQQQTLIGLRGHDRLELASKILEQATVDSARVTPDSLALLDLLEGHPLAMQIALPLLKEVPASVLLAEIRRGMEEIHENAPEDAKEEGRPSYLTAVMEYSWSKMTHRSRTHLPVLALFQRRAMMDILTHITQERAYRSAMGEELGWGACRTMLRSAQSAGFLEPISPSVYQIHPALPWFFGRKLTQQLSGPAIRQLELEFLRVYADTADYFMESLYENQASGVTAILAEEGNLTQALGLALEAEQWDSAQLLVQPLAQVYRMQKRYPELQRLRGQLLESVGVTAADANERGAIELWVYLQGTAASEATELLDLNTAEDLNQQLLEYLVAQPEGEQDPRTAAVYHQLGIISLNRHLWDEAAGWLQKSLAIIENGEDLHSVADDHYALGQVRQGQRLYTEAKEWYQKALDIHQRIPDEEEMVKDYRALGMISHLKFEYQEAESWYYRARDLVEESRDEETAVQIYPALGTIFHAQSQFDEARERYEQALHLSDRMGNREQMVVEFHHLGLLAQARGILFDEAEEWYLIALETLEDLGDRRGVGDECRQLGVLCHEQKRYDDALKWY